MPSDPKEAETYHSRLPISMAGTKRGVHRDVNLTPPSMTETNDPPASCKRSNRSKKQALRKPKKRSPSWKAFKTLLSCKNQNDVQGGGKKKKMMMMMMMMKGKKIGCPSVVMPEAATPEVCKNGCSRSLRTPCKDINGDISTSFSSYSSSSIIASATSSSFSSLGGSFRGIHLRRLSGCYECQVMVDSINGPCRDPSMRATLCSCPNCGEVFVRPESLELHQALRHAVSELGPEDTSRNIVEIIFQSSWLKNQTPICKIERILKVHNTQKAIARFEDYRDSVKMKANKLAKKHPRCVADGNELLRFHCTTFACSLGLNGSTHLCQSIKHCNVCSIIRDGFRMDELGRIPTMATSGRAHDMMANDDHGEDEKTAMLVCRVIAGRVKRSQDTLDEFDSVSGSAGTYSSLDELFVFSPKAILPCFVVIYGGL
ncbi:hypothetical protein Cni_G20624 [Canna indica]|uniref:C2H2-type domain-containing protein n=1 Tax=Canna indica TaxID=4628 RepID=A0AAQ3KNH4_9LILI|nr:hypothetical protein Cni_G20624 [Canna indica]